MRQIFSNFLLPTLPIRPVHPVCRCARFIHSAAPGITATNRVRTVLFECLFNHLADERVESCSPSSVSSMTSIVTPSPTALPGPPHVRPRKSRKSWPISAVCLTAKRPDRQQHRRSGVDSSGRCGHAGNHLQYHRPVVRRRSANRLGSTAHRCRWRDAFDSGHALLSSGRAGPATVTAVQPRPLRTDDALPERASIGDADARDELVRVVYGSPTAGPDDRRCSPSPHS